MVYTYKKSFLGGKFVERYSSEERFIDLKGSKLKIKSVDNGFILSNKTSKTPVLTSLRNYKGQVYEGEAVDNSRNLANFQAGQISEGYVARRSGIVVTADKRIKLIKEDTLDLADTGLEAILGKPSYDGTPDIECMLGRESGWFIIGKNAAGKYGAIDESGKVICPFQFDSPDIKLNHEFVSEKEDHILLSFVHKGTELIVDRQGNIITEQQFVGPYQSIRYDKERGELLSVYNKKTNKSSVVKFNFKTGKLEPVTTLEGQAISTAFKDKDGSMLYETKRNTGVGIVREDDSVVVPHNFYKLSTISTYNLKENLLEVSVDTGKKGAWDKPIIHIGIYSMDRGTMLVQPAYDEFHYSSETFGVAHDGLLKVAAKKDGYWGVVNENGQTEVPHEYIMDNRITSRRVYSEEGYSRGSVSERAMRCKDGSEAYLNVTEPNIIASPEEVAAVKAYHASLAASAERDRQEKAAKEAAVKAEKEAAAKQSAYDEETTKMAIGASILTGSPVAGMIVKAIRDENGPSNG